MAALTTLLFDYGNTLIAFGPAQQDAQLAAMRKVLDEARVAYDLEILDKMRMEQVLRPYKNNGIENDFRTVCHEVAAAFAPPGQALALTEPIMRARQNAFHASVTVAPAVPEMLARLKKTYRLGLLSNYPCDHSISGSLKALGLYDFFDAVVVSGVVGFAKPHPRTYAALLAAIKASPEECMYIGDNWLADVQGAKRHGMKAAWVREHVPYEVFEPNEGDHPADLILDRLVDLESALNAFPC
jgi:HAD superfamily hydrolase (TIGR01509 family)